MEAEPASVVQVGAEARPRGGMRGRVTAFRARVRALPGGRLVWRAAVTIVGVAVVGVGILLLPLPGPGWLVIFAGLGLLATEYTWAARLLGFARRFFISWTRWATRQRGIVRAFLVLGTVVFVAAIVLGLWWFYTVI